MTAPEALRRRDELVRLNLPLVRAIAFRVRRQLGPQLDREDLEAHGRLGLVQAAARFRRSGGVCFATYAGLRIRGAMLDAARSLGPFTRRQVKEHRIAEQPEPVCHVSCSELASGDPSVDDLVAMRQVRARVRRAVAALPGPELAFIQKLYFEGKFLAEAGRDLGVSRSWASRLHARAVARLREALVEAA